MPNFYGYHGTDMVNGEKIVKEKRFCFSRGDIQWLGDGIYFFEDYKEALSWAIKVKKFSMPVVVGTSIISDKVFNLTHGEDQCYKRR